MHKPIKYVEKAVTLGARATWAVFDRMNRIRPNPAPTPKWSDKPLLKSYQKSKPPLGWPRSTDSLCPKCVPEIRQQILDGHLPHEVLINEKVGEIKATIIERDGKILMVKECPVHGRFEDLMSIDTEFSKHLEDVFPGRDIRAHNDEKLHKHGSSTVKYGRGSVLTIDLTNRCNMMCDPCFMDANQVGFVHELQWEEIKTMLDNAITIKPRRQMSVQFSGGEPTLSPYFLDAVRYARKVGYNSVQAATNGIEFAKSFEFAQQAAEAGLRYAYLQFDGIGNAANAHRKVGNLFDVKLKAIDNLHRAGVEIVPVVTIVNGINNEQVGRIIQFALDNPKKIGFLSFQPVSFTGRDEAVTDDRRQAQRYTLSHLAHDVKNQTSLGEPARDWFPISFMSTFSDWADLMHVDDLKNDWGQLSCGCHPNCGTGMAVMIDKETKEAVPVTAFLHGDQLAKDIAKVNDASRGKFLTGFGMALCLMKNYNPFKSPTHFKMTDLLKKFDKNYNVSGKNYGKVGPDRSIDDVMKRRQDRWNFLFIAGMWFQDLFNYDFRRTEQCIIPYATQEGEISFCAYNTGVGWRNIIEKMHMTATLTKWYEEHGRHEIFAGGKNVGMESNEHSLYLRDGIVTQEEQRDLDKLGIAKNAGEEKKRARDAKAKASGAGLQASGEPTNGNARGPQKNDAAYNARMASLYREVVLKEKAVQSEGGFISLDALVKPNGNGNGHSHGNGHSAAEAKPEVAEPVAGD
jgi:uncharacterized radical SAM superfamily Fe-S cluster-containing enzyme